MEKAKTITIVVVVLLSIIIFLQNTQSVETKILFMTQIMPRVLLLAITFLAGFVVGLVVASYLGGKARKEGRLQQPHGQDSHE